MSNLEERLSLNMGAILQGLWPRMNEEKSKSRICEKRQEKNSNILQHSRQNFYTHYERKQETNMRLLENPNLHKTSQNN